MTQTRKLASQPHGSTPYKLMTDAEKLWTWLNYTPNSSDMERTRRQAVRRFARTARAQ